MQLRKPAIALLAAVLPGLALAGPFGPAAGQPGSQAVAKDDASIKAWATGYEDYVPGTDLDAQFMTPEKSVGEAGNSDGNSEGVTFDIVSLGRGGSITLTFATPIVDGAGFDFAVFENSFSDAFLELATVSVSSDGINFVQFDALSTVPAPVNGFGAVDATDLEQLAGKYRGGFGTPFDLAQLAGNPLLDVSSVSYVRLQDVVGDGSATNDLSPATLAHRIGVDVSDLSPALMSIANNAPAAIYDPYPTTGSAGFDLDAVAVMNQLKTVVMDVGPWDPNNEVQPDSTAILAVGLMATSIADGDVVDFDPATVNPASLRFGYTDAPLATGISPVDLDGDADNDALLGFRTQDSGIVCDDTSVELHGETLGGEPFMATDFITTTECDSGGCH